MSKEDFDIYDPCNKFPIYLTLRWFYESQNMKKVFKFKGLGPESFEYFKKKEKDIYGYKK